MSASHKGMGDCSDTVLKNQNIYFSVLINYYENGFMARLILDYY